MEHPATTIAAGETRGEAVSEQELRAHFRAGSEWAFDLAVDRYQERISRLLFRLLGRAEEVDDLVQEVFLAAYRNRTRFRGDCSLATWLSRLAVNRFRNHLRKHFWRRRWVLFAEEGGTGSSEATPCRGMMDGERSRRVQEAIGALPAKYREVVLLRYLEEMEIEEIAIVTNLSRGAVDVRLTRAREKLKEIYRGLERRNGMV